jgi:hypothetical protein
MRSFIASQEIKIVINPKSLINVRIILAKKRLKIIKRILSLFSKSFLINLMLE